MHRKIILVGVFAPVLYAAEDNQDYLPMPLPPDLPPTIESGETLEPDITIIHRGEKTIQEYRVNGELYMVKIIPDIGPSYYLIDSNGDGNLSVRRSDLEEGVRVPQWLLFSW